MHVFGKRLVAGALWGFACLLVGIAGYHWFTHAGLFWAALLTIGSALLAVLQFHVAIAFAAAVKRWAGAFSAVALVLFAGTVAGVEGWILYDPVGQVLTFVLERPAVPENVGELEAQQKQLADAEAGLREARTNPDTLQGAVVWAFTVVRQIDPELYGAEDRLGKFDFKALNDGDFGPESQAAFTEALGLLAATYPRLEGRASDARKQEAALAEWERINLIAVVVLLLFELVARFGFSPWLDGWQKDKGPAAPETVGRLRYDEAAGRYTAGGRELSLDDLMARKWAPAKGGRKPGRAPAGHCWQPYPSKADVQYYCLRRNSRQKKEKIPAKPRLKLVHSAGAA